MTQKELASGGAHEMPLDLQKTLITDPKTRQAWEDITPLARNEWICWVESAKHSKTRKRRIERTSEELIAGKRRPCCWAGCIHRTKQSVGSR